MHSISRSERLVIGDDFDKIVSYEKVMGRFAIQKRNTEGVSQLLKMALVKIFFQKK